jgi:hypothetical protein
MENRLLLAYGAWFLLAVLIASLVFFSTRAKRAYSRENRRNRKSRK